jgi:hypothetical protein
MQESEPKIETKRGRGRPRKMPDSEYKEPVKKGRGRPPKNPGVIKKVRVKKEADEPNYRLSKPPYALAKLKYLIIPMPPKLIPVFGKTFTLNNDITSWYCFHSKRLIELSETTQRQYKLLTLRLSKVAEDPFERVIYVLTQPLATKAQFIKAWLNHLSDTLYDIYLKPEPIKTIKVYEELVLEMFLFAELSKRAKTEVNNAQMSQLATEERIDNTIEWDEWTEKANKFAMTLYKKDEPTVQELTEMAIAGLYSMLPPIRLDYDDVKVVVKTPTDRMKPLINKLNEKKENAVVLGGKTISAFYWYKFKNASAFEKEGTLPIVQPLTPPLIKILTKYWNAVKTPTRTKLFELPHFSEKVSAVAKIITGKNFTNRLMRSSFIQDFYMKVQDGKLDLDSIQAMMRSIHQTNIEVSLSYIKKLAEEGIVD